MAIKQSTNVVKKVEKKIRQKILVEEGGCMNSDIPYKIQNIFSNILKYNSASDAQIRTVENTYRRHLKG